MEYKDFTARTVDEAITLACLDLGVTSDRLEYDVVQEASLPLYDFCHHDGCQLAALLKADGLVVDTVAIDFVLRKHRPRKHRPRFTKPLFSVCDIALTHRLRHRVAPERIVGTGNCEM